MHKKKYIQQGCKSFSVILNLVFLVYFFFKIQTLVSFFFLHFACTYSIVSEAHVHP